jgi:hypothetical protein
MRKLLLFLAFFAVLASVQAFSFNHIDVNSSENDINFMAGDENFVSFVYTDNGEYRVYLYEHSGDSFDDELITPGITQAAPKKIEIMHVPGYRIWAVVLDTSGVLWASECTTSGNTITGCNQFSLLYPWTGTAPGNYIDDFAISYIYSLSFGSYVAIYYEEYTLAGGTHAVQFVDVPVPNGTPPNNLDTQWYWENFSSVGTVYSAGTTDIHDLGTTDVWSGDDEDARNYAVLRVGTNNCLIRRFDGATWGTPTNGSVTCSDHGDTVFVVQNHFENLYDSSIEYDAAVFGYWDGSGFKLRHYLDNAYTSNSERAFHSGYYGSRACAVHDPSDYQRQTASVVCGFVSSTDDAWQSGFTFGNHFVLPSNTTNDLESNVEDYTDDEVLPQTYWQEDESQFAVLWPRYTGFADNDQQRLSQVIPGTAVTFYPNANYRYVITHSASSDSTYICPGTCTIANVSPATGYNAFAIQMRDNSVGPRPSINFNVPETEQTFNLSSFTYSFASDKVTMSNSPAVLKTFELDVPVNDTLWSQRTVGGGYSYVNSTCQTTNVGGNGYNGCTDGTRSWTHFISSDVGLIYGIENSGGGVEAQALPEFPMHSILLIIGVVLIVTFFISRVARRKSLE